MQQMYYVPAGCIPGKVAYTRYEWARTAAEKDGSYIMDQDGNIIEDFRGSRLSER